jgi:hypothetical protein
MDASMMVGCELDDEGDGEGDTDGGDDEKEDDEEDDPGGDEEEEEGEVVVVVGATHGPGRVERRNGRLSSLPRVCFRRD